MLENFVIPVQLTDPTFTKEKHAKMPYYNLRVINNSLIEHDCELVEQIQ